MDVIATRSISIGTSGSDRASKLKQARGIMWACPARCPRHRPARHVEYLYVDNSLHVISYIQSLYLFSYIQHFFSNLPSLKPFKFT